MCGGIKEVINGVSAPNPASGDISPEAIEDILTRREEFQQGTFWRQPDGSFAPYRPAEASEEYTEVTPDVQPL